MVAQADLPESCETSSPIKLLDLLTNRYHTGVVRETSDASLDIELPATTRLAPGQRVRFIVGNQPLVARNAMRRGYITEISASQTSAVRLALRLETAVG